MILDLLITLLAGIAIPLAAGLAAMCVVTVWFEIQDRWSS